MIKGLVCHEIKHPIDDTCTNMIMREINSFRPYYFFYVVLVKYENQFNASLTKKKLRA